ncbi:thiosulfate sulfurtransferase GlpE [Alteromonas ponticola]|uniref:Thiosulfate sulfurtransferase GlpE n=1 Tax=Alteromonas aquimaris TaxID=2998417 RepID=A0ABT3PB37_9ALTE|nr:thiosulfate sulfurtransferase GlpE [Alteromonas aquimaris]MCW8109939.1 thiosulfate sulfurtransferase GlpE [Alteromonas aquimaris]
METFHHISVADVAARAADVTVVDIRDPQSFALSHMPGATHLSNDNFAAFLSSTAKDTPVVVVCYHGISSQQAARVVAAQGFTEVYSMDGGFEAWRQQQPVISE